jgi:hypothetical protein
MADVTCEGCGHAWHSLWRPGGIHRVTRCQYCPPRPETPDTHTQLEDLLNEVGDCERRENLQDRFDLQERLGQ